MTAISNGGAAQRVKVLTAADLRANGGSYALEQRAPVAVYGVTDAETTAQGGDYVVMGNVAQPVYVVSAPTGAVEATIAPIPMVGVTGGLVMGNVAIPVYVVGGSLGGFPAPANLALSITGAAFDVITATWDAVSGATDYEVEYSDDGVTYTPVDTTALLTYGVTSADYDVDAVTHYIRVRATGGDWAVATIDGDLIAEVGRWLMNEVSGDALDSIGANPLSDINNVPSASDGDGNYRVFGDVGRYFRHADNSTFSMGPGVRCTIAVWVNPTALTSQRSIVVKREALAIDYWLRFNGTALDFSATSDGTVGTLAGASKSGASTGAWQFAVAVYDGSTLSANLDNGTPATTAFSADIFDGTVSFNIGMLDTTNEGFDGGMRRLRLWKRALSAAQLTKVFNDGY